MPREKKYTPKEIEEYCEAYILERKANKLAPTLEGLALFIGCSKDLIWKYGKRPFYAEAIKKVKLAGEVHLQNQAQSGKVGAFFLLKTIHGYTEQSKLDISGSIGLGVVQLPSKAVKQIQPKNVRTIRTKGNNRLTAATD